METLSNLESFVRSAETGSFSGASRLLALTPAAVSRNVARLERNLGTRLFHRSTRKLTLTEAGERFLLEIADHLAGIRAAVSGLSTENGKPSGVLKISMSPTFGANYILPLLPEFLTLYPAIRPDWQLDNRHVDLIAEGFDAAIGGGFELAPGLVSRVLAPAHIIAVASPKYLKGHKAVVTPADLARLDGIYMRSQNTGRIRLWTMRNLHGTEQVAEPREALAFNDPATMVEAAVMGLGVALVAVPDALPYLDSGKLKRLVTGWWADAGAISLYYSSRRLLPAKTRVFIDFVVDAFRKQRLPERFAGSLV